MGTKVYTVDNKKERRSSVTIALYNSHFLQANMSPTFRIRLASLAHKDSERILAFFDSQLPWLASVGSAGQWGTDAKSSDEALQKKYRGKVERSEACAGKPFSSDWTRAYILEAEVDADSLSADLRQLAEEPEENGKLRVPVAALVLEAESVDYVRSILPETDKDDPFISMAYLLSDRRTNSINHGAGAVLIEHAKEEARNLGVGRIVCDCWAGNGRKLVR